MRDLLVTLTDSKSVAAEAYRTLRTNIQFSSFDEEMKIITVTSSRPSEGKSTVACNMAVTFAENGNRVLLIDADLRRPTVHKKFKLPNSLGIVNLILEPQRMNEIIHEDVIEGLDIVTSGAIPPNPSELLGSKRNRALLSKLREEYDTIILDTPPLLAVTDAQVLTTISDGTVIVAQHGVTKKDEILQAKSLLEKVKGNILGVVLSQIPMDDNSHYYYYSYEEKKTGRKERRTKK
ncbi:CpsD/CapB family tyrosine-protein kinase [Proteiniclasticum sp. SCR006]|uniref:non-specific protein-tyrosine kinase n=1 Tax=Proteiniclasticum aestuarii TaxID=2817862 RepID=A0A939H9Y8_9CLOT|nr:CpsD/CapB family tyrosine-protein kinase [Proteiniclasticum aestuarii]MBO1265249.1 CpsD/CapB family tyrosine-protein kinase [Proteiniclasticum aestuarii]